MTNHSVSVKELSKNHDMLSLWPNHGSLSLYGTNKLIRLIPGSCSTPAKAFALFRCESDHRRFVPNPMPSPASLYTFIIRGASPVLAAAATCSAALLRRFIPLRFFTRALDPSITTTLPLRLADSFNASKAVANLVA